jgi:CRP/FNR family transcriptional regulator, dissimilatory nitrate respiration regulator
MAVEDWLPPAVRNARVARTLRAGETLFRQGGRTAGIYEVASGRVRLARVDRAGREAVLYVANAGETLGEASLFARSYQCDAIATTDAAVRLYPKALLLAELARDPNFAQAFAAMLAQQVMALRTRLERCNIHSARDRVRHFLAVNIGADGRSVALTGTLKELAADLGLTHEALYRTLARMAADGEIERTGGMIRLAHIL